MAARSQTSKHYSQAEKRRNYSAVRCLPCSWCRMGCVVRCPTPWNHAHQPDPREGPAPPEDLEIPSVLPRYPASPSEVSASLPPQPLAPAMNHGRLVSGQRALRWLHVRAIPIGQGLVALSSAEPSFTRHRCPLRSKVSNCEKHKRRKRFTRAVLHAVDSSSSPRRGVATCLLAVHPEACRGIRDCLLCNNPEHKLNEQHCGSRR
jgi:hypothetical protein